MRHRAVVLRAHRLTRSFSSVESWQSGHSRWSTIRHDKAKNDAAKNKARSSFSHEIALASRISGPSPDNNPRLADLITKAKKNGFPKQSIEAAIARGQGKSATGASLEAVTIEAILPGNIGVVIDCESDSRKRTLQELRLVIKRHGGAASPSSYLFTKKGRIVFEEKEGLGLDEALEAALEAGALDVEEEEGVVTVFTQPDQLKDVGQTISDNLGLQITSSDIISAGTEDLITPLPNEETAVDFAKLIDDLHASDPGVQGVYMNTSQGAASDEAWGNLQSKLNA